MQICDSLEVDVQLVAILQMCLFCATNRGGINKSSAGNDVALLYIKTGQLNPVKKKKMGNFYFILFYFFALNPLV